MRHLKRTAKLGRKSDHRNAMLANMVCSLIKHKQITTTLAKAKAARSVADKMVTLGKSGSLHSRRLAAARLYSHAPQVQLRKEERRKWREKEDVVRILFDEIAPAFKERNGGYTRIIKLGGTKGRWAGQRQGDASQRAILEWVDYVAAAPAATTETAPAEGSKPAETAAPESK
jgi:large subunit ribosomal protein L17